MNNQERKQELPIKKALYAVSIAFMVGLIGIMTLADAIIEPNNFNFFTWFTKTVILVGIEIPSIILGECISTDYNRDNELGKFQRALHRFDKAYNEIIPIQLYFKQFFFWFTNQENFRLRVEALEKREFDGLEAVYIVRYVSKDDLEGLEYKPLKKTTKNGKEIIIKPFGKELVGATNKTKREIVLDVLNGKYDVKNDSYSYFLFADSKRTKSSSIVDEGVDTEREISKDKAMNRFYKIVVGLIFSVIWAMIAWDSAQNGINQASTWINLFTRLATMAGGLLSGWLTGVYVVKLMSRILDVKATMLELYKQTYDKKEFVPKTYEEMAMDAWQEQEAKDKEAKESVIIPDVVKPQPLMIE